MLISEVKERGDEIGQEKGKVAMRLITAIISLIAAILSLLITIIQWMKE
jgi:hypothetical protein